MSRAKGNKLLDNLTVDELKEFRKQGFKMREIAESLGVSYYALSVWINRNGLAWKTGRSRKYNYEEILIMYEDGVDFLDLELAFNCSLPTIKRAIKIAKEEREEKSERI